MSAATTGMLAAFGKNSAAEAIEAANAIGAKNVGCPAVKKVTTNGIEKPPRYEAAVALATTRVWFCPEKNGSVINREK